MLNDIVFVFSFLDKGSMFFARTYLLLLIPLLVVFIIVLNKQMKWGTKKATLTLEERVSDVHKLRNGFFGLVILACDLVMCRFSQIEIQIASFFLLLIGTLFSLSVIFEKELLEEMKHLD